MNRRSLFKLLLAAPLVALVAPLIPKPKRRILLVPPEDRDGTVCVTLHYPVAVMDSDGNYPDESWAWTPTYEWRRGTFIAKRGGTMVAWRDTKA